jgi:hypothetical protein
MMRKFAIVRDDKIVGLFDREEDAEGAVRNLSAPSPPGKLEVVTVEVVFRRRRSSDDPLYWWRAADPLQRAWRSVRAGRPSR